MTEQDFDDVRRLATQAGFTVDEARRDEHAFGSWFVYLRGHPRLGLVWDGKDGWLCLRRETDHIFNGIRQWEDLWIARDRAEQSAQRAVDELRAAAGQR